MSDGATMNYIDTLAYRIFEIAHGGGIPTPGDVALYRIYAVLGRAKGQGVTAEDVHDAWAAWMLGVHRDHRSLKPFSELTADVQRMDDLYVEAIHRAMAAGDD